MQEMNRGEHGSAGVSKGAALLFLTQHSRDLEMLTKPQQYQQYPWSFSFYK